MNPFAVIMIERFWKEWRDTNGNTQHISSDATLSI